MAETLLEVCTRLRHLPGPRWQRAPLPPMGSRPPGAAVVADGPDLEHHVRAAIDRLMAADAAARGVRPIPVEVGVFSLPDVLAALARSITAGADATALAVLDDVTADARRW